MSETSGGGEPPKPKDQLPFPAGKDSNTRKGNIRNEAAKGMRNLALVYQLFSILKNIKSEKNPPLQ